MSEEILMNITPRETRVAVVENGVLQEVMIERAQKRGYVGNVYKGRVLRIMPGIQAAFVDIGLERSAFLHVSDILPSALGADTHVNGAAEAVPGHSDPGDDEAPDPTSAPVSNLPSIESLLQEGQLLVVQVVKDPIGSKGARLSMQLSIPSRYLVLMPHNPVLGVSARIEDKDERDRLKALLVELGQSGEHGYIVRTHAEGGCQDSMARDMAYLGKVWDSINASVGEAEVGHCLYEDLSLPLRCMRDYMREKVEKIRVDSRESHARLQDFARKFIPELAERVEHYAGERPIFDLYGVEDEILRALHKEVSLKSGGHLTIDQTEAMTTVDVNTGAFLGHRNLEETAFRTNLEAAQTVARQLRLRNLGGIIIIDFIGMLDAEHRRLVLRQLEKSLAQDRTRCTVHAFSPLGLVEMTRKRTTESLERQLCESCPTCDGRGSIKTCETVCYEIFREITRAVRQFETETLLVLAAPRVVARILDEESAAVAELEEFIGKTIRFQADENYVQEQYDVVLL